MSARVKIHVKTPDGKVNRKLAPDDWFKRKMDWATFYKRNIHRFIEHYLKVNLYPYQIIWIYFMSHCDYFITIASRASAKSWLIALYAICIGILYPHSEIVVVSETQKQAGIIMGKIEKLIAEYPNINREVVKYSNTSNNMGCLFRSTSTIKIVACKDSGRGERATLTIGEEFRRMKKVNYDSIVKPFAYARRSPYMDLSEWEDLPAEEPKELLISSAYHKGLWWYTDTCKIIKRMINGENVGFIAFDYLIALRHKIKTKKLIERDKSTMDFITFMEEYENIPWGENTNAYFKLAMFERTRKIHKAFYPQRRDEYTSKKNPYAIRRTTGEVRVISADISTRSGSINDNTIFTCTRCLPTLEGYIREVCYMESHNGANTYTQALRAKQLFYEFEADYFVLDIQNAGMKNCPPVW